MRTSILWLLASMMVFATVACTEDHPGLDLDKLIFEADQAMYNAKAQYYMESGHDRRISRTQ